MKRRQLLGGVSAVALGLSGCARVPTSGPIERAEVGSTAREPQVEIKVEPPQAGDTPRVLIEKFLEAMTDYQHAYSVAREFLTDDQRDVWRPESGVQIIANDHSKMGENSEVLEGLMVGVLDANDIYSPARGEFRLDLGLRKNAEGEWRIGKPPPGLVINQFNFRQFYTSVNLYFFELGFGFLVPSPIMMPKSNLSTTTIVQKLLRGPAEWLRPVVVSAYPEPTSVIAAPVNPEGVVELPLSGELGGLSDDKRRLLAAQTAWTLRQIPGLRGLSFSLNGAPYVVPGAVDNVVELESFAEYAPVSPNLSRQLFGASADGLMKLDDGPARAPAELLPGALGSVSGIEAFAVSVDGARLAVVSNQRRRLLLGQVDGKETATVETKLRRIDGVQFTRHGDLIAWGSDAAGAKALARVRDQTASPLLAELPSGVSLTTLRVAPDGVRAAVVVSQASGSQLLGLMRLHRGEPGRLSSWRPVPLSLQQSATLTKIAGLGWSTPTELVVLAADTADSPLLPYRMNQDGIELSGIGSQDDWQLSQIAVSPQTGAATSGATAKLAVLGRQGVVWRNDDDTTWNQLDSEVRAVAYPG